MFDFDASKLIVIGILALIFIGPKDLPKVLRQVGMYVGKMRRMAREFQTQFSDAMRESELAELKKDMEKISEDAKLDVNLGNIHDTEREIREALEKSPEAAPASETKTAAIRNPTPDNDVDGVFADIKIPPAEPASAHDAPVREVGLEHEHAAAQPVPAKVRGA